MPSFSSSSRPGPSFAWTVTTPFLPTAAKALPITSPSAGSSAEIVATRTICSRSATSRDCTSRRCATTCSTARSIPRRSAIGSAPAETFLMPCRTSACVSSDGRRRAVARDRRRRLRRRLHEPRALAREHVDELDLARDRDAVVRDQRAALADVEDDVAALRAERHLDRVGDRVDAREQRGARVGAVGELLVRHQVEAGSEAFAADAHPIARSTAPRLAKGRTGPATCVAGAQPVGGSRSAT